ncbi:hypothetical protein FGO68_gene7467 [Halteria grandinella]|uniref:Uncharacterized protein n=1 Tax=Halteria grandinella TaxID=5974 RepID=A0A8J8P4P4_HALGN|nr:hypothetical protein FGO68_gene7467 [Halteria grandinella]
MLKEVRLNGQEQNHILKMMQYFQIILQLHTAMIQLLWQEFSFELPNKILERNTTMNQAQQQLVNQGISLNFRVEIALIFTSALSINMDHMSQLILEASSAQRIVNYILTQFRVENQAKDPQFPSIIESQIEINSKEGAYMVNTLVIVCEPNSTQGKIYQTY